MVSFSYWEFSHCIDLTACTSGAACIFAFLGACGVPADTADAAALMAWLARSGDMSFGLIVQCPEDLPPSVVAQLTFLLQRITKVAAACCLTQHAVFPPPRYIADCCVCHCLQTD